MTTAVKKTKGKRSSKSRTKVKRTLVHAQGEQCFWASNGAIISTLVDLAHLLASIEESVYKHHARKDKNDFADWVEFVLGDSELAASLRKAKKPKTARTLVVRRLKVYNV